MLEASFARSAIDELLIIRTRTLSIWQCRSVTVSQTTGGAGSNAGPRRALADSARMSDARPGDMREKVACRPRGEGVAGSWTGGGTASGGARQPNLRGGRASAECGRGRWGGRGLEGCSPGWSHQWLGWLDAAKLLLLSSASASVLPSPRPKRAERAARLTTFRLASGRDYS